MLASSWKFIVENWDCHKESIQFKFGGFIILSSSSWWWVGRHRYKFWEEEVPEQNAFLPTKPSCFWLVLRCSFVYTCVNVEKLFIIWFSYITLFLGHNWLFMQCLQFLAKTYRDADVESIGVHPLLGFVSTNASSDWDLQWDAMENSKLLTTEMWWIKVVVYGNSLTYF